MEEIDPLAPQREAALFYGLFLRGHSADALRREQARFEAWLGPGNTPGAEEQ